MLRLTARALFLLPLLAVAACSTVTLSYPPGTPATVQGTPAVSTVTQKTARLAVTVGLPSDHLSTASPAPLVFTVTNLSRHPITFGPENVAATSAGKTVPIYTYAEIHAIEESDKLAVAAILNSPSQSLNASVPTNTYNSGTIYPTNPPTYRGTTYDPEDSLAQYHALQATTILPGQSASGLIYFMLPSILQRDKLITFTATIAGQSFVFPVAYK